MGSRVSRLVGSVLALVALSLLLPTVALAAEAPVSSTAEYNLDFTLPSESKSGCLVCHGDPALIRIRDGAVVSFYIDAVTIAESAHFDQQCVGCHIDFTYKAPHGDGDWVTASKSACKNCHEEQSRAVGVGVHRLSTANGDVAAGDTELPLCGDCHGSHDIAMLTDSPEGQAALHAMGWEVCGRCHEDYWDSYRDYYHGAAYKRGAEDAPACWDCHGWHDILPSSDRGSRVNEAHLVETCGQDGCHFGVDENYTSYAVFIHGRDEIMADNLLYSIWRTIADAVGRLFGGGKSA